MSAVDVVPASLSADNPLSNASPLPFALPPFAGISAEHCREALLAGMAEQRAEIAVIAGSAEVPTFENTVVALERSGELLTRAWSVF
ncbi:MAG TPA: M3 family peptidase, partial [Blastococcus sp.]